MLFLANKKKQFRDFRAESYIPANIISEDSKKQKQVVALKQVYTYYVYHICTLTLNIEANH